jgi:hypothetical protein
LACRLAAVKLGPLKMTGVFAILAVYSFFIQALGVYYYPHGQWDQTPISVSLDTSRVWDWRDNPILRTARGGPVWKPYAVLGAAIREGKSGVLREMRDLDVK